MQWPPNDLTLRQDFLPFEVTNNIPRYVRSQNYASLFGDQWHLFPKTQLDSYTGLPISENRLRRCMGETLWKQLTGKKILEVGCGAGRFTELLLREGGRVVSVDMSHAVDINAKNFPASERHTIVQSDILNLPFTDGQFDIVVCLGVLQHTPDPQRTLLKLYEQLQPGGVLVVDQYIFNRSYWSLRLVYRQLFKRLPAKVSFKIIFYLSYFFLPLHKTLQKWRVLSIALNRFSPFVTYYRDFPELNDTLQKEWSLLDTFDTLTDWHKNFGTLVGLKKSLEAVGFSVSSCCLGGNGIEARCQRPKLSQHQ